MRIVEPGWSTPATEAQLLRFQEVNGVPLPSSFAKILLETNGGVPAENTFTMSDGRVRLIERFLALIRHHSAAGDAGWYDIDVVISQLLDRLTDDEDSTVSWLVPFAALFAGDFLCFDYRTTPTPKVVVWDHEASEELAPVVTKVANSFDEFIPMLRAVQSPDPG